ncbi:tRNA acetyltransferase Tan1p [Trichomonascus vanleenenianus]|uniref:putative tRNA acetyltransferase n=1 Tax=Trichomonascus vanleenenianus TaxID=2268995 RepID=UPI003ECB6E2D
MGKRKAGGSGGDQKSKKKKYSVQPNIEPGWRGIYATCVRGQEKRCRDELKAVLDEYAEKFYGDKLNEQEEEEDEGEEEKEGDFEAELAKEIAEMNNKKTTKSDVIVPLDLGCECVVFFRVKKPIEPAEFVLKICDDAAKSGEKKTRYTQRLTPVSLTGPGSLEGLQRITPEVLKPHFFKEEGQEPVKFAINTSIRNHNVLSRTEIIENVAKAVGKEHGHSVDLKNFDKLIMVQCFKSSVGVSVVERYEELGRFNLQQIYENALKQADVDSGLSRVAQNK